jgi:hypothetical protein
MTVFGWVGIGAGDRLKTVKSKHHINRGSPCIAGAKTRALSAAMR